MLPRSPVSALDAECMYHRCWPDGSIFKFSLAAFFKDAAADPVILHWNVVVCLARLPHMMLGFAIWMSDVHWSRSIGQKVADIKSNGIGMLLSCRRRPICCTAV